MSWDKAAELHAKAKAAQPSAWPGGTVPGTDVPLCNKANTTCVEDSNRAAQTSAPPKNCPTCDSPAPHLHPAVQFEGEVQVCRDAWHSQPTNRTPVDTKREERLDRAWEDLGNTLREMGDEETPGEI